MIKQNVLILNGSEIKLNGINYIEEFPGSGISGSYNEVEYDVKNLKDLGCNVIKVYGRAASPYLVNLCNRYGLFGLRNCRCLTYRKGFLNPKISLHLQRTSSAI
jgi:beta-galactosidase/beta-glucuronidase